MSALRWRLLLIRSWLFTGSQSSAEDNPRQKQLLPLNSEVVRTIGHRLNEATILRVSGF